MVVSSVGYTITTITRRMSYLQVFGEKITTVAEIIKLHLSAIEEVFEHNDATPTPDWLIDVVDAVTDLGDLLDDQGLPADAALLPKQTKIASFSSLCKLTITRGSLLLQLKQIEKQLQRIADNSTKLSVKNSKMLTNSNSKDKEIKIVGRETYKERIINRILTSTKVKGAVPVVTIRGIRGMGKTTLAKFVCDDETVKSNFDLVIWIDGIHDESYAESIVQRMIHESASKKKKKKLELEEKDTIVSDENLKLREAMSGSRFLLVLDDLQSENREEWLRLQQILRAAASSSDGAVLVTTPNSLVANVADPYAFPLDGLSEEESWTLFEQITGGGGPSESKIKDAQKKMVSKCRGVPIAILTMARMLKSGEALTESEMDRLEKEFMQEIKSIYYDELPSWHLKQCFAYLPFIFSRAYDCVTPDTLIRLWMAEGFLGPMNSNSSSSSPQRSQPEDLGLDCIREFGHRSILKVVEDQYGMLRVCVIINQLVLELSTFVAGKDRFCMDDQDENVKETVRRVSLTPGLHVSHGIPKSLIRINKNLRTILFPMPCLYRRSSRIPFEAKLSWSACVMIFCACKSLRVLNLADLGIKMLPVSIGELKSLRYLNLSHNNMKKLPNSIGKLKRLQTLILSYCHQLRELPSEVEHLVSLRHLEMEECLHMTHMPSALKKLTNLQTLSHFVASRTSNNHKHIRGFEELINLNSLRGTMEVSHLDRLKFKELEQDGHAYLKRKQHLKQLTLKWNHDDEDNNDDNNHDQISLGHLEPHPNLQELRIVGYKGTNFSDWLLSLKNLVGLILYNCSNCQSLPPLDQFPKLKILELQRLDCLEYVTDQDDGCNKLVSELLVRLSISDCPNLTSWWKGRTRNNAVLFGSISRLLVKYCPKLDCMPLYPNLDHRLELEGSSVKPLLETINYSSASNSRVPSDLDSISNSSLPLSKLKYLKIKKLEEQSPLPEDWLKNLISLQTLWISEEKSLMKGFKYLSSLTSMFITNCTVDLPDDEWEGLQSLQHLGIEEVIELKSLPEGIKHLTSLKYLSIESCPELMTLTEGIGHLKSLEYLLIYDCHKLALLPKEMSNLTSLKRFSVRDCPLLLPRCQKETGDDWPQIKHIKDIQVEGTSEIYE